MQPSEPLSIGEAENNASVPKRRATCRLCSLLGREPFTLEAVEKSVEWSWAHQGGAFLCVLPALQVRTASSHPLTRLTKRRTVSPDAPAPAFAARVDPTKSIQPESPSPLLRQANPNLTSHLGSAGRDDLIATLKERGLACLEDSQPGRTVHDWLTL